jgi:hypothetical protein
MNQRCWFVAVLSALDHESENLLFISQPEMEATRFVIDALLDCHQRSRRTCRVILADISKIF